jgi:dTDP-4-dehydrorhamnose reductase
MRELVIGASGLLGGEIFHQLGGDVIGTYCNDYREGLLEYDLVGGDDSLLRSIKPDVIFLCSALTNVEECERDPVKSYEINVESVYRIVKLSREIGCKLIYFSTDYIFSGFGPFIEGDIPSPLNVYGKHKLLGESLVLSLRGGLVFRLSSLYGDHPRSSLVRGIEKMRGGDIIYASEDQYITPTNVVDAVRLILSKRGESFIIHVPGSESISKRDYFRKISNYYGLDFDNFRDPDCGAIRPMKGGLKSLYSFGGSFNLEGFNLCEE